MAVGSLPIWWVLLKVNPVANTGSSGVEWDVKIRKQPGLKPKSLHVNLYIHHWSKTASELPVQLRVSENTAHGRRGGSTQAGSY